ncbi:MAG TPA: class I tRNA ligase family protein, partial [Chitinophagaceae bacterium]|nr:class I tRNA ligase family protein [Chitinophagaceae bacterium]
VVTDPKKKNPVDFVLWFKTMGRYEHHILRWDSPWGQGFPGWHIECSAMSKQFLGETFDIHMGGIDLKFPHHTNEIAQSEAASGKKFVNYWVHSEHLLVNEGKMAKSEGNFITIQNVIAKGFNPLAYRYLTLTAHYRSKLNFSWDSLTAAQNALHNLYSEASGLGEPTQPLPEYLQAFNEAVNDDLDTPKAIAVMWDMLKSEHDNGAKLATLLEFDKILGLNISEVMQESNTLRISVKELIQARDAARAAKDYAKSDKLRQELESKGLNVEDTPDGTKVKKKF